MSSVDCAPHEQVWIRAKSDPKLETLFEWTGFSARKSDTLEVALSKALEIEHINREGDRHFYAYKLVPIELEKTLDELDLKNGQEIYLSSTDLMAG